MDSKTVDLKKINEKIECFYNLGSPISEKVETDSYDDNTSTTRVYHLYDDLYLAINYNEDSYGSETILGMEFVTPVKQTVIEFEPIK